MFYKRFSCLPQAYNMNKLLCRKYFPKRQFETLVEMQINACKKFVNNNVFGTRRGDHFEWITYLDFNRSIQKFRNVLIHHNIGQNDKIALISNNRVEWAVIMFAASSLGAVIVPMYEAQLEKDWRYIVNDSDAKLVVVANESIFEKTKHYLSTVSI